MCHHNIILDPQKVKSDPETVLVRPERPPLGARPSLPATGPRNTQSWEGFRLLHSELKTSLNPDLSPPGIPLRHQNMIQKLQKSTFSVCHQNIKLDPKKVKCDPAAVFLCPGRPPLGARPSLPASGARRTQSWEGFHLLQCELKTRLNSDRTPPGTP